MMLAQSACSISRDRARESSPATPWTTKNNENVYAVEHYRSEDRSNDVRETRLTRRAACSTRISLRRTAVGNTHIHLQRAGGDRKCSRHTTWRFSVIVAKQHMDLFICDGSSLHTGNIAKTVGYSAWQGACFRSRPTAQFWQTQAQ